MILRANSRTYLERFFNTSAAEHVTTGGRHGVFDVAQADWARQRRSLVAPLILLQFVVDAANLVRNHFLNAENSNVLRCMFVPR